MSSRGSVSSTSSGTSAQFISSRGESMDASDMASYLAELLREKSQVKTEPKLCNLVHAHRLLDKEAAAVRSRIPEPKATFGEKVTLTAKHYFPKKQFPDFNFVGRIIGPNGATIKSLERHLGCQLAVRGRACSNKHSSEETHILVTVTDLPDRAKAILDNAALVLQEFLVPVDEGKDRLKESQMKELARRAGRGVPELVVEQNVSQEIIQSPMPWSVQQVPWTPLEAPAYQYPVSQVSSGPIYYYSYTPLNFYQPATPMPIYHLSTLKQWHQ